MQGGREGGSGWIIIVFSWCYFYVQPSKLNSIEIERMPRVRQQNLGLLDGSLLETKGVYLISR